MQSRGFAATLVTLATFTDLVAYSVAVPVLPDLATRLGASPTVIGLLFASFGATLLAVSIPMGAVSDRVGRKLPMAGGMMALALSTLLFAFSDSLPWLFAARLVQGAADGVTWVVGFALLADLYGPAERGRVMGIVMAGTSFGLIIGPTLGGWLYELGGAGLPFMFVAALAAAVGLAFLAIPSPAGAGDSAISIGRVLSVPAIALCAVAVAAGSGTHSMLEPVLPLFFHSRLGLGPARIGLLFGAAALASTIMHPIYGRMSDRWGGRRLTLSGLIAGACLLPLLNAAGGGGSAAALMVLLYVGLAMMITPSLAYMAQAASTAKLESFGVVYGIYNVAWAMGLLGGPAIGGFLFDRIGFAGLTLAWSPALLVVTLALARVRAPGVASRPQSPIPNPQPPTPNPQPPTPVT